MDTVRIYHVPVEGLTKYYKLDVWTSTINLLALTSLLERRRF